MEEAPFTWKEFAWIYPQFVQWIVQKYGGVPDGQVKREDYERFRREFLDAK